MKTADQVRIARMAETAVLEMGLPASERPAARAAVIKEIEAEEAAAAQAAREKTAQAEAQAERARVAAVVAAGRACGRARLALRMALAGPVEEAQARAILPGLPVDAAASPDDLAIPGAGQFGPPGAQAERARLCAIFAAPVAAERFGTACALALEGDAPAAAVLSLLASLPTEAAPRTAEEILGARAEGLAEFGADHSAAMPRADRVATGWKAAVAKANACIGATAGGHAHG